MTKSKETTQRFHEIKEAYDTLSNEKRRKIYDEDLFKAGSELQISRSFKPASTGRVSFDDTRRRHFSFTDDFFGGFVPGFFEPDNRGLTPKDLYFEAVLSPREAMDGGLFPISVPVVIPCPRCNKTGWLENLFCPVCSGVGRINSEKRFSLSIPPRVKNGAQVSLSLEDIGLKGAYLNISVLIDPDIDEEGW